MPKYASVYILDVPCALDRAFDYFLPGELGGRVKVGGFVLVPFGGGNRRRLAIVTGLSDTTDVEEDLVKPVTSVCDEEIALDERRLALAFYLREQTLCTMGEAVHSMIPSSAFSRFSENYSVTGEKDESSLEQGTLIFDVYAYIKNKHSVSESAVKTAFGAGSARCLERLVTEGYITKELKLKGGIRPQTSSFFSLAVTRAEAAAILGKEKDAIARIRSQGQRRALEALMLSTLSEEELILLGVTKQNLRAMAEKGLVTEEKRVISRDPYAEPYEEEAEKREITLSEEQNAALEELVALSECGEARAALLHGVTGSGKTSVMMALIDRVIENGKGVILLLPEISLTPQTVGIFRRRYGALCGVIHSGLSLGERYDTYMRIKNGEARIVIGTRSAVFSPVKDLGLIVIDEEQEATYKSDQDPKYHARDVARYRCASENALMLLASATPSLESYLKAKEGKYKLIKLRKRYGGAKLPEVCIADMRGEAQSGNLSPIGLKLSEEMRAVNGRGEQSILFINRRGYNTFVSCRSCGEALTCPNCSVSMTYHTRKGTYKEGYLVCHTCGHKEALPKCCPSCGSDKLAHMGYGTQRVEEELQTLVPGARVLRMDTDTTTTKFSYDRLLGAFRDREADILLGTQMVTKGHDFPAVTLVGVLLADASLYLDDYRASERTFSMLTQVIGRAGRAAKLGKAIIQTNNPDNDVIKLAAEQDYETFFEREIKLRRLLVFPPYCDIVLMTVSSEYERELFAAVKKLCDELKRLTEGKGEFSDVKMQVFGPFEAPVYKAESRYRMRMVVKCRLNKRSRELFGTLLKFFSTEKASGSRRPVLSIDFNPSAF